MFDVISSWRFQLKNIALVLLSLLFLPLSTPALIFSYARPFSSSKAARRRIRRRRSFRPKTVLVTGIGTTKGLFLGRTFYQAGHDVIGADFEPYGVPINARFSRSLRKFYSLTQPNTNDGPTYYLHDLLSIVQREKVDLWVSCSGAASAHAQAKEIIERRSDCVAIQFDVATTKTLHEKRTFIQRTRELGLPVPETHEVASRTAVHKILHSPAASKKKYIMKSVGADNASPVGKTLLPRRTTSETYNHISAIPISSTSPWVLQEYIRGQEYCTHALVINNVVKAFVACPCAEHLSHYDALPSRSALSLVMRRFTQEFARRSPPGMTGHLSFDFIVQEVVSEKGLELALRALACNPYAHTAMVLFSSRSQELAEVYLSALVTNMNGNHVGKSHLLDHDDPFEAEAETETETEIEIPDRSIITPLDHQPRYYWIGHDIVTLFFAPLLQRPFSPSTYFHKIITLLQHLFFWNDAVFVSWDPLPWWWLYHVYWPGIFLVSLWTGRKWSRVDISTGEVIYC